MVDVKGQDWLYIFLGVAAFYLVSQNTKAISGVVSGISDTASPIFNAAAEGSRILTDKKSYKSYAQYLLEAPFTGAQSWQLFKQQPGISTGINALFTNLGLFK